MTLGPEYFLGLGALSATGAVVKGAINFRTDYKRGRAIRNLFRMGWNDRVALYPRPEESTSTKYPVVFKQHENIVFSPTSPEAQAVVAFGEKSYIAQKTDKNDVKIRPATFFTTILSALGKHRPEIWQEHLKEAIPYTRVHLDAVYAAKKRMQLLDEAEKFTGVTNEKARSEISDELKQENSLLAAKIYETLSVFYEWDRAKAAYALRQELQNANEEKIAAYDALGTGNVEEYPVVYRRDIQVLWNGAAAIKKQFVDKYGEEVGLTAVSELSSFINRATTFLAKGTDFNHIYQGLLLHFGPKSGEESDRKYVDLPANLEDFQRLYAPDQVQAPAGVFGELYPNAFYNIAISRSSAPEREIANLDLR